MKRKIAVWISLIALIVIASFLRIHIVRSDSGGTVLWNDHEAYLFLGAGNVGYEFSYLEYPLVRLKEYFYAPPIPSDKTLFMKVIHVTVSSLDARIVPLEKPAGPAFLTPTDETFYAMCPGAVLCKWNGTGFVPATKEEAYEFGGLGRLIRTDIDGKTINGWSARYTGWAPGRQFEVNVGGEFTISAVNRAKEPREYPNTTITLLRPGEPPQILYNVDGAPHWASKAEYFRDFPNAR